MRRELLRKSKVNTLNNVFLLKHRLINIFTLRAFKDFCSPEHNKLACIYLAFQFDVCSKDPSAD